MSQYKVSFPVQASMDSVKFSFAKVEKQFDNIKVVNGSEEIIFNETYVTGLLNNRPVKIKLSALTFSD